MTKVINNESVNKSVATAKANATIELKATDLLKKINNSSVNSLLKSNAGISEDIYKKDLFKGLSEKEIKSSRRKFRNYLLNIFSSLINEKIESNKKQLIEAFNQFYKEAYRVNNYEINSLCSSNLSENKKAIIAKGLEIVKSFNK